MFAKVGGVWASVDRWLQGSLRRWLILPLLLVALANSVFAGIAGHRLIDMSMGRVQTESLTVAVQAAADSTERRASQLYETAARLATHEDVLTAIAGGNYAGAQARLSSTARLMGVPAATLVDPVGRPLAELAASQTGPDLALQALGDESVQRSIRQAAAAGAPLVEIGSGGTEDQPILYAVSPVLAGETLRGLVVLAQPWHEILPRPVDGQSTSLVLYADTGRAVYSTFAATQYRPGDLPPLDNPALIADHPQTINSARIANIGYQFAVLPVDTHNRGVGYVAAYQPVSLFQAQTWRLQALWWTLMLMALVLVFVLALWAAGRVVRPVKALAAAADSLAAGGTLPALPRGPARELHMLADTFDRLSGQVIRQNQALSEQVRWSNYLFEASAELGHTLDLAEALQAAADALMGLDGISYVAVLTGRGELGPYTCGAVRGLDATTASHLLDREFPVPLWGVMARALVGRQPLVIDDIAAQNRPRAGEFDWDVGHGSMLLFPIIGAGGPSGLIITGSNRRAAFSAGALGDLTFALARIASRSVQNAQLYQDAVRSQEQMLTVQAISKMTTSFKQLESLLEIVAREAAEVVGGSYAWLVLQDPGGDHTRLYGSPGSGGDEPWGAVHGEAVAWVMKAGEPIYYDPAIPLASSPILTLCGRAVCVPLEVDDEIIGALVAVSRKQQRDFDEDDMIVLRTLANAAAVALRTAQLTARSRGDYLDLARAWAARAELTVWGRPGHAARVAHNALVLAGAAGLPASLHSPLEIAAYLHDIALDPAAEQPGRAEPVDGIPAHAATAAHWLADAALDPRVVTIVRHHHIARADLRLPDGELGLATSILSLVNVVDLWLSAQPQPSLIEVGQRLLADNGCTHPPHLAREYAARLSGGSLTLPGE